MTRLNPPDSSSRLGIDVKTLTPTEISRAPEEFVPVK